MNDADRLGRDPAMRWLVGGRAVERGGASTSQMGRFETELLATDDNLAALADLSGAWIDQVHRRTSPQGIVLDMDSSVSPTYGEQERTAYNGHFACTCYHPLFVFNQFGDLERCALRAGNVHSAQGWRDALEPVVARYRHKTLPRYFRADAAFASPEVYEFLEAEGFKYAIRLPANSGLQESIGHLLGRPVGRPPVQVRRYHANFSYRAGTWDTPRRVVAKVEWHPGELYPRVRFIVTSMTRPAERVVDFYNGRGTAEQWVKEGKNAIKWTRLSCSRFRHNAVRLQLHAPAYDFANFLRTLALPEAVERWSLTTLRAKLVKIGAKIVRHGRYIVLQMAEVAIPRDLFADYPGPHRPGATMPFPGMLERSVRGKPARAEECPKSAGACAFRTGLSPQTGLHRPRSMASVGKFYSVSLVSPESVEIFYNQAHGGAGDPRLCH